MKPDIEKMQEVWDKFQNGNRNPTPLPKLNLDEIISAVFATGPFYYYLINFFDMSISRISQGFTQAHGQKPKQIKHINDILSLIHPDDMEFVAQAEKKAYQFVYKIGVEKVPRYKVSYNFRFKTADGSYRLFNHQSLVLTLDENNNFIRSLNIHTDISHITRTNNYKWSAIGLAGERTYLNMKVTDDNPALEKSFSKRELEVIRLISKGHKTKDIAEKLFITTDTVKTHRKHIMEKSGCAHMAELTARSISEGWI